MAILAIFTGNISKEQYESLRNEVNWEKDQPEGGIFHVASFDESGKLCATDVWEDAATMNSFVENRLIPAMKKLELSPPDVVVYPTYNINAYNSIEKHKI